jgi:hypothetical protein
MLESYQTTTKGTYDFWRICEVWIL